MSGASVAAVVLVLAGAGVCARRPSPRPVSWESALSSPAASSAAVSRPAVSRPAVAFSEVGVLRTATGASGRPALIWAGVAAGVGSVGGVRFGGPGGAALVIIGSAVGVLAARAAAVIREQRARAELERAMPGLIDSLARSFRSGAGAREAVEEMVASAPERVASSLDPLRRELHRGRPVIEAVERWLGPDPVVGGPMLLAVLAVAIPIGGSAAPALDRAADSVRVRHALGREVKALSSQARSSATVLAGLPVAFSAMLSLASPDALRFFVEHPAGPLVLAGGLLLDGLGLWWMRLLVERAT